MNPSCSAIARAIACPASCALPRVERSSDQADRGTAIHAYLAQALMGDREGALAACTPDILGLCQAIPLGDITAGLTQIVTEVALLLDLDSLTAGTLGRNLGRAYGDLAPMQLAGTADLIAVHGDTPVILDFKTGLRVTDVRDNWQMRAGALALALSTHADAVEAALCYVGNDGAISWDHTTFSAIELLGYAVPLRDMLRRVADAELSVSMRQTPSVNAGSHCGYCPAFDACPAHTALARHMIGTLEQIDAQIEAMSPEEQGIAWEKAQAARRILDRVTDALKLRARTYSLPLPDGKHLGLVEMHRRDFDSKRALHVLREHGASESDIASCYRETTVAQLRELKRPA